MVPLLAAIAVCHCSVLWWGEGDDQHWGSGQLWGSGRGAIAGCHCSVLWLGGEGDDQLWGWTWCHCRVPMAPYTAMASRKSIQKSCLELLADVTLFSTLMPHKKLVFAMWGLCWYNFGKSWGFGCSRLGLAFVRGECFGILRLDSGLETGVREFISFTLIDCGRQLERHSSLPFFISINCLAHGEDDGKREDRDFLAG